jgi:hypothetical protein
MLCARCQETEVPDVRVPGSDRAELVAWCCLLLPGLLYAAWRHANQRRVCARCGSSEVLRVTRAARRMRRAVEASPSTRQPELLFAAPHLPWMGTPLARLRHALRGGVVLAGFAGFALFSVDTVRVEPVPVASAPVSAGDAHVSPKRRKRECERLCTEFHRSNQNQNRACQARCIEGVKDDPLAAISGSSSAAHTANAAGSRTAVGYHAPGERGITPNLGPDPRP